MKEIKIKRLQPLNKLLSLVIALISVMTTFLGVIWWASGTSSDIKYIKETLTELKPIILQVAENEKSIAINEHDIAIINQLIRSQ